MEDVIIREKWIEYLLEVGFIDVSKGRYPNKPLKRYLKLFISEGTIAHVSARFDYPGYKEVHFDCNTRFGYSEILKYEEIPNYLKKHKLI